MMHGANMKTLSCFASGEEVRKFRSSLSVVVVIQGEWTTSL